MKKYTFLIGNGFDLGLGLKTQFSDFFQEYRTDKPEDSEAVKRLKGELQNSPSLWSDFESQMGKFTEKFVPLGPIPSDQYFECMEDFRISLVAYLVKQQELYLNSPQSDKSSKHRYPKMQDIEFPLSFLRRGARENVERSIRSFNAEEIEYNFLVFNYTQLFDTLLNRTYNFRDRDRRDPETSSSNGPNHRWMGATISDQIGSIVHVHGEINDVVLMGLDNYMQVANCTLAQSESFRDNYIKPYANNGLEDLRDVRAREIIQDSDLIFIFGMSLGNTDATWWKQILQWLSDDKAMHTRFLIVFKYDKNLNTLAPGDQIFAQNQVRARILDYASELNLTDKQRDSIRKQIYCSLNSDFLFYHK